MSLEQPQETRDTPQMDGHPTFKRFRIHNTKSQATLLTSQGHLYHYSTTCRCDFIQLASFTGNNRFQAPVGI
jgi:hypothetical protein